MTKISGGNQLLDPQKFLADIGVKPGQRVADLGCGAVGHFVFPTADLVGPDGLVYAVDIRRIVLEGIKNRARVENRENIRTIWSNLEIYKGTGILDNSLDSAMLINVLFQNKKMEGILKEAIRMVKPGGQLVVVDWRPGKSVMGPPANIRVKPEEILQLCKNNGMTLVRELEPSAFHFCFLFTKK